LNVEAADVPLADVPAADVPAADGPPADFELAELLAQAARVNVAAAISITNLVIECFTVKPSGEPVIRDSNDAPPVCQRC
jgi:hypothetical protein